MDWVMVVAERHSRELEIQMVENEIVPRTTPT